MASKMLSDRHHLGPSMPPKGLLWEAHFLVKQPFGHPKHGRLVGFTSWGSKELLRGATCTATFWQVHLRPADQDATSPQ